MSVIQAARDNFKQYATFHGRATRSQYWSWFLFQLLVSIAWILIEVVCLIGITATLAQQGKDGSLETADWVATGFWGVAFFGVLFIYSLFVIASFVPELAAESRRLHDANFSAWWLLLWLIPIGRFAVLVMLCFRSYPGESRFAYEGSGVTPAKSDPWSTTGSNNSTEW